MNRSGLLADQAATIAARLGLEGCHIVVVSVEYGDPQAPEALSPYRSTLILGIDGGGIGTCDGCDPSDHPGLYVVAAVGEDSTRVHLLHDMTSAAALVHLANGLQDWAIELTHGQELPACPGHAHPMRAVEVDGDAAWVCPKRPAQPVYPVA